MKVMAMERTFSSAWMLEAQVPGAGVEART